MDSSETLRHTSALSDALQEKVKLLTHDLNQPRLTSSSWSPAAAVSFSLLLAAGELELEELGSVGELEKRVNRVFSY